MPQPNLDAARYVIGVDPGVRTGVAEFDRKARAWKLYTSDFWQLYETFRAYEFPADLLVVVEDPARNRPVFDRGVTGRRRLHVAQSVGGVKREATLLIEGLRRVGVAVIPVAPVRAQKWDAAALAAAIGYTRATNEHERDAARLARMYSLIQWRPGPA